MRRFTFLSKAIEMNGIHLREEIVEKIYEFCAEYHDYIEECKEDYLTKNPHVEPGSNFVFPIPHIPIFHQFDEGKLWHAGSDWSEVENKLIHYLFIDSYSLTDDYVIEVEETDYQEYIILNGRS